MQVFYFLLLSKILLYRSKLIVGILVLKVPSLAMGVGVVTLSILSTLDTKSLFIMLGFDLSCLALISLSK